MLTFNYKRINVDTVPPKREHKSAGWDLFCDKTVTIEPGVATLVSTGIKMQYMTEGWVAFIKEKSGLALKSGIQVHGGVVDCDYRGEIGVILKCNTRTEVHKGMRVAQMVFIKIPDEVDMEEVDNEDMTSRMGDGFGSTM